MFKNCVRITILWTFAFATPAFGWHEVGHILTTLVAYKQLSPGEEPSRQIKNLVAILRKHPRFKEDFLASMPPGMTQDQQCRWLLSKASVWPDQVRMDRDHKPSYPPQPDQQGSYNRPTWHYIDIPLIIAPAGCAPDRLAKLEASAKSHQSLVDRAGGKEALVDNVLQAIDFNSRQFRSGMDEEKAVALCWLLHLTGDIHQPLHAAAAFSRHTFEPEIILHGDEGGNSIRIVDHRNLHALWDAAPDAHPDAIFDPSEPFDTRFKRAYARACEQIQPLLAEEDLVLQAKQASSVQDPKQWAQESYDLAKDKVYSDPIRQSILLADESTETQRHHPSASVSDSYLKMARSIGKSRVLQSGFRIAKFFEKP